MISDPSPSESDSTMVATFFEDLAEDLAGRGAISPENVVVDVSKLSFCIFEAVIAQLQYFIYNFMLPTPCHHHHLLHPLDRPCQPEQAPV
jgi:hypothetical protein